MLKVWFDRNSPSTHCALTEACPWSCAAFQDIKQISSPEESTALEHFLLAPVPPLWTDQFWQAVCQNATILSVPIGMCSPKLSASSCSWISLLDLWVCLNVSALSVCIVSVLFLSKSAVCDCVTLTQSPLHLVQGVTKRIYFLHRLRLPWFTIYATLAIRNAAAHSH